MVLWIMFPDTSDCVPICAAIVKRPASPSARAAAGSRLNTAAATSQQRAFIVPPFGTVLGRRLALRAECNAPRGRRGRAASLQSRDMLHSTGVRLACVLLPLVGSTPLPAPAAARPAPAASRCSSRSRSRTTTTTGRCTCPRSRAGPASAAWSPDGRELVVLDAGLAVARRRRDGSVARQLTDGPGYDYQPDWSPDGRCIAYASLPRRRGRAVAARPRERAQRGRSRRTAPSTSSRAGRPTATRLAFVSTALEGPLPRLHVSRLDGRRPRRVARLTEDHDAGLPRYYYSRFDHYLSPTWSPDGSELILVSNRGHIWGTGGFWRMKAEPGAPHARDPRRGDHLEGAARLGARRPARGLQLLPRPAVEPALAHDRRRRRRVPAHLRRLRRHGAALVAATAAASRTSRTRAGNTVALDRSRFPAAGGRRVEIRERRHLAAHRAARVVVVDASDGPPLPARVSVTSADGRSLRARRRLAPRRRRLRPGGAAVRDTATSTPRAPRR